MDSPHPIGIEKIISKLPEIFAFEQNWLRPCTALDLDSTKEKESEYAQNICNIGYPSFCWFTGYGPRGPQKSYT